MKLKLKKFIELKKDEHKIFVIEQDEEGNVNPDALFLESDLCDEDMLKRFVSSYRLANENDIYHGAEENSLCVELSATQPKERRSYKRNVWPAGTINLNDFVNYKPQACDPQSGICNNPDCPFNNGTCLWIELVNLAKSVKRDQNIKVKKGGIN